MCGPANSWRSAALPSFRMGRIAAATAVHGSASTEVVIGLRLHQNAIPVSHSSRISEKELW